MMNLDPPGLGLGLADLGSDVGAPSVGVVCGALHELYNCPLDGDFADKLQVDGC